MIRVLLALPVLGVLVAGCASDAQHVYTVGLTATDATAATLEAAQMWEAADPALSITVIDGGTPDVLVRYVHGLPPTKCAQMHLWPEDSNLDLNPDMSDFCREHLGSVIAHELGHYMSQRNTHLGAGALMSADTGDMVLAPTAADVAYEREPVK